MKRPYRTEKLAREIHREVSRLLLFEVKDPRVKSVTITRVELTGDFKMATVHWSTLGGEPERKAVGGGLAHAKPFLFRALGKHLDLRAPPDLFFKFDKSVEESIRIAGLLDKIAKERPIDDGEEESAGRPAGAKPGKAAAGEDE